MPGSITKGEKGILKLKDRLIVSIDVSNKQEIISLCSSIKNSVSTFKIGLEVIYSCGLDIIKSIKSFGYDVMLDAKLHDIPNTVSRAISAITAMGVSKVTVHASGGREMICAAAEAVTTKAEELKIFPPMIFAVTVLTSLDDGDLKEAGFKDGFRDSVLKLAKLAQFGGAGALVCSPNEAGLIKKELGPGLIIATPGIRLPENSINDQKRINTPYNAIKNGADYIIAGRPVTQNSKPYEAVKTIINDIEKALALSF
ncbi:MAG: orotidine-5'-phosphate decarboxylase [Actinobacteria bacterium]|nr:orotidine-5'-phosphate decarboxylase [Actinomycetota bacterium]